MIVDDASVVRRGLAAAVDADPELTLAGTAGTGGMALQMIPRAAPDIVVLDVEMPGLSGLAVLEEIRRRFVGLPVVMYASKSARTEADTVAALAAGAVDFVLKPGVGRPASQRPQTELLTKVKQIAAARRERVPSERWTKPSAEGVACSVDVVAIGASTGGPNALSALISALPEGLAVPTLIVQHMPRGFTAALARRLDAISSVAVAEAVAGAELRPGTVWVAPGDRHMEVDHGGEQPRIRLHEGPLVASCRPSVDVLFQSLVPAYGKRVLGVVLTGLGRDGLNGARAIAGVGGQIVVQDRESSVVWGMPGAVARENLADCCLPLGDLAHEIERRAGTFRGVRER